MVRVYENRTVLFQCRATFYGHLCSHNYTDVQCTRCPVCPAIWRIDSELITVSAIYCRPSLFECIALADGNGSPYTKAVHCAVVVLYILYTAWLVCNHHLSHFAPVLNQCLLKPATLLPHSGSGRPLALSSDLSSRKLTWSIRRRPPVAEAASAPLWWRNVYSDDCSSHLI